MISIFLYNDYDPLKPLFVRKNNIDCSLHVHIDSDIEIVILLEGTVECVIDSKNYKLEKGNAFFVFPHQPHFYLNSNDVDAIIIIFKSYMFNELKCIFNNYTPDNPIIGKIDFDKINIELILDSLLNDLTHDDYIVSKGYAMIIASKLLNCLKLKKTPKENKTDFLISAKDYCFRNFCRTITLNDVAEAVNVSPNYLSKVFKSKFGMNFNRYLSIIRVNYACRLLADNYLPISEIAFKCGFASIRTFNRVFQKEMNMSPSEYRQIRKHER